MAEMVEGKEVRCIQVGGGTPCDGRSRPTQTRGFFDSSLLAGVRKLFFILTEIKLD
jgi:hypothetical protein